MLLGCVHWGYRTPSISMRSRRSRTPSLVSSLFFTTYFFSLERPLILYHLLLVAEKLKREGRNEIFEQETMEELEDEEGNVYNRKTYEDLKKQGLI